MSNQKSPEVKIKIRQTSNLDLIKKLDSRCFPADDPYPPEGAIWWVAYAGDFPVAFAGLKYLEPYEEGIGYLCRVGVLPAYRGHGLQRRFLQLREKKAIKLGIETIITYTVPENFPSINSLIRGGFMFYDPDYAWAGKSGKDAFYFIKQL